MQGMPRTCGEASPPPALQHVTAVRGGVSVREMPRTCGEAYPPLPRPAARYQRAGGGQRAWDAKNLW